MSNRLPAQNNGAGVPQLGQAKKSAQQQLQPAQQPHGDPPPPSDTA